MPPTLPPHIDISVSSSQLRDRPLENLWARGADEVQKKYSRQGKLNEKNSCTPINPKRYSCYGLKKIPTARKFPAPSLHNFSNGPSLNAYHYVVVKSLFIFLHSVKVQQHQGHRKLHHCHCDHHCSLRHSDFRSFYYWMHGGLLC